MNTQIFTLLSSLLIATISMAQIIHVPDDEPSIQAGIDAANDGDTVLVAQGTYYENISFDGKAITVASHYLIDPDSSHLYNTILDGIYPVNPNLNSMVYFTSGEDTTSVLCGFTIQYGSGTYPDCLGDHSGGGIICENSGAKIIHNRIVNNYIIANTYSGWGAGISGLTYGPEIVVIRGNLIAGNQIQTPVDYLAGGGGISIVGHHIIEDNVIKNNSVTGWRARGAGIAVFTYSPGNISNNEIQNNVTDVIASGGLGSGIYVENPGQEYKIVHNQIENNICTGNGNAFHGGGIAIINADGYEDYIIDRNKIINNEGLWGGGIYLLLGNPGCMVTNNLISHNQANTWGGGICCVNLSGNKQNLTLCGRGMNGRKQTSAIMKDELPQVINNTIINNSALDGGGIANRFEYNDLVAFNNIIFGNQAYVGPEVFTEEPTIFTYLDYNDVNPDLIFGNWIGSFNIFADPMLDEDILHLTAESPCIDAGSDNVFIGGSAFYSPEYDIDKEPRPLLEEFDIGADEWDPSTSIANTLHTSDDLPFKNAPNPFAESTLIAFELSSEGYVELKLFDLSGKMIRVLLNNNLSKGKHEFLLDAFPLEPGVYFCTLKTMKGIQTRKIIKR